MSLESDDSSCQQVAVVPLLLRIPNKYRKRSTDVFRAGFFIHSHVHPKFYMEDSISEMNLLLWKKLFKAII